MTVPDLQTTFGGVPAIWGGIPQRNKNFTGRDDILAQLRQGVSNKVTVVLPHALQGMGGVGKTAVAIEYAHRYRSEYELVWWIPADQPTLVRSSLAALAEPLGLQSATASGIESAATAVLNALRRGEPSGRWLLIFDNADQPEDLNDIIPRGPGDVLITSRNHRWQSVVDTVQVNVFSRAESTDFLAKRVPKGIEESDAARLAEELGDLPLALEQAGALQAETGMSVDEYLRLLKDQAADIMAEGKSPDYPLSMTAAWKLSVSTMNRQLPQATELLRCCAFFGPEPIPRDVFRRGTLATQTRVSDLLANPILLARAIRELGRFALVRIDGRTIGVHRLIQALLRDELDPNEQARYRHEVHLILAAAAPADPDDNRLWPRFRELVAHVAAPATGLAQCRDPAVRAFALNIVRYLSRSGDNASSRLFAERFIAQWTKDSGPDEPTVLDAQRHLGNALRELGQYSAAFDLSETTLRRVREILGEHDSLTLALTNSFGADLRARGDFVAARVLDEGSLGLHQGVFGPSDPQTLRVMNNLALDYGLNSKYKEARELHQRTYLLQSEATSGVSATDVLNSWNCLARAVRLCGDYSEARDVGEDAYDYGREVLGPDNYMTLRTARELSIALRRIATAYDDALDLAEDVLNRSTRLFGAGHPDTLAAAISLTNIQRTIGQTDSALGLAENTVASYPGAYGPDHPYSHGCTGNLALLRRVTGDAAGARRLDEAALAGLDDRLSRDHHYSLTVATNLASDFAELGEIAKARALGEDTLDRLGRLLGETHPLTLGCAANLVADLRAAGAEEEADRLSADTLERYAATLGIDHPDAKVAAAGRRLDFDFDPPAI
ncbi:MAG TPA: FxSxx-COOH system tetratricopeptide repeat protein [Streptosporangiaceae bacterium]